MYLAIAILGLAVLILIHEAGHFFAARALGMRPRRFYIGFPPAIAKVQRNGIEYGIGAIPLGGYVKIPGMHRPAPSDMDVHFGPAVREEPSLVQAVEAVKRHIAADDLTAAATSLGVLRASVDAAPLSDGPKRAAERGFQELGDGFGGDAYWRARTWKRVLVILAGPGTNFLFALVIFAAVFMVGDTVGTTRVDKVLAGHPAAVVGLRAGDDILAVNRQLVTSPDQIAQRISSGKGRPLTLVVIRNARSVVLGPIRPKKDQGVYRLGFQLQVQEAPGQSLPAAAWSSLRFTGVIARETGASLYRLVHHGDRKDISGTVGIVQASSQALRQSTRSYLVVLGLISLSLALLNMLPLLPLDGGHIAFSIVEGLRGRAIRREIYERVSAVGIALVLLIFFVSLTSDIGRLSGS